MREKRKRVEKQGEIGCEKTQAPNRHHTLSKSTKIIKRVRKKDAGSG